MAAEVILGMRKTNGEKYPPRTLHMLLSGLQRYMREQKENMLHIYCQDLPPFRKLVKTCDSYYCELCKQGVGAATKETEVCSLEAMDKLWGCGVFGADSPRSLLNAVFFCIGLNFLLRGGNEHHALKFLQLSRNVSPERRLCYTYTKNVSKNWSGE